MFCLLALLHNSSRTNSAFEQSSKRFYSNPLFIFWILLKPNLHSHGTYMIWYHHDTISFEDDLMMISSIWTPASSTRNWIETSKVDIIASTTDEFDPNSISQHLGQELWSVKYPPTACSFLSCRKSTHNHQIFFEDTPLLLSFVETLCCVLPF